MRPHNADDGLYLDLQNASGLHTFPETELDSPLWSPTEESASFVVVVCRAAKMFELQLPTVETKANLLTEILQPGPSAF